MDLENRLLFKKYKLKHLLDKGSYGYVYIGENINNNKLYAIKIENRNSPEEILEKETFILYNMKGFGIPEVITFGRNGNYNILVQTLLGKSIQTIWEENGKKL